MVKDFELKDTIIQIAKHLNEIPAAIADVHGNSSEVNFEDYITPNMTTTYEIDGKYLSLEDLTVSVSNCLLY